MKYFCVLIFCADTPCPQVCCGVEFIYHHGLFCWGDALLCLFLLRWYLPPPPSPLGGHQPSPALLQLEDDTLLTLLSTDTGLQDIPYSQFSIPASITIAIFLQYPCNNFTIFLQYFCNILTIFSLKWIWTIPSLSVVDCPDCISFFALKEMYQVGNILVFCILYFVFCTPKRILYLCFACCIAESLPS